MSRLPRPLLAFGLLASLTLAGCLDGSPREDAFVKNAKEMLQGPFGREGSVCLPFPSASDYASFTGALPRGWIALLDAPTAADGYEAMTRRNARPKLEALVQAGLLRKEPYELVRDGKPAAATRYLLSDKGREALSSSEMAGTCLQVGTWQPQGLTLPRSGLQKAESPELITRKTEGELTSYEAHVKFELKGAPDWAQSPALQAAFGEQLGVLKAGKTVRVELVKFNNEWVAKQVLAAKMAASGRNGSDSSATPREIPQDLHEAALARLNSATPSYASRSLSGSITLPVETASETPRELSRTHPGAVFLAEKADPQMQQRARTAQRLASLDAKEKSLGSLPIENQRSMREMLARERAALAKPGPVQAGESSAADRYLTARGELQAVLEALVEAGAYDKRAVGRGEVPGAEQPGTLYSPRPGVIQSGSTLASGTVRYSRIVRQQVAGASLLVHVAVEPLEVPEWAKAAAKSVPALGWSGPGTRTFLARPLESGDFPYAFSGM